jgi:hypothetical protein
MNSTVKKTLLYLALVLFVLLLAPQFAMSSGAGIRTTKSSQQSTGTSTPMMPMPLVAPLFIANEEFTSTLVLVNGSALQTYADVILRGPDGTQVAQKRVTFDPHSQRTLDLGVVLREKGSNATTGSVVVMPSADLKGPAILAALSMTYLTYPQPNFIDQELAMPSSNDSQILRGVADRGEGSPLVAVTSLADAAQHVRIDCLGRDGVAFSKTVAVAAGGTALTEACSSATPQGADFASGRDDGKDVPRSVTGIALTSDGMPGSFAAFGLAPHRKDKGRYFSSVSFADPEMVMSPNTVFTGVPVGPALLLPGPNYVPELSLANFSNKPAHVTIQYASTSGDTPTGQEVWSGAIPALHTNHVRLDNLQGDSALQNSFVVTSDGAAGDLVAKLVSETGSEGPGVEVLGKDEMVMENGGAHPWSLKDGTDSTLLLFNHSGGSKSIRVLLSAGSVLWQKQYTLKSMETLQIGIGDLIQNKVPDESGKTIPAASTSGIAEWFSFSGGTKGRILQSDATTSMARNFSCGDYADVAGAVWSPSGTTDLPVGTTGDSGGEALAILDLVYRGSCSGSYATTTTAYNYYYTSSAPYTAAIAYPTDSFADVNADSVGYATITGTITDPSTGCSASAQGSVEVVTPPSITSISPAVGPVGASTAVTIAGSNFGTNLRNIAINAGTGISATPTSVNTNGTQIQASFAIVGGAPGGNHSVTITVSGGPPSNSVNFFVQIPTSLGRIDEPGTPNNGTGSLNAGTNITILNLDGTTRVANVCGGYQWFTYALADQQANRIQSGTVTFTESFNNISPSPDPLPAPTSGQSGSPNLATQVLSDIYANYNSAPACPTPNVSDSFDQHWTATAGGTVYNLTTVIHITRATNGQGLPTYTSTITTP